MMPAIDRAAVVIIGPRIEAPNSPRYSPPFQPTIADTAIQPSCPAPKSRSGAPIAPVSGASYSQTRIAGAMVTSTATRVAWIRDSARTSAPASCPKMTMSCSPPGMAA